MKLVSNDDNVVKYIENKKNNFGQGTSLTVFPCSVLGLEEEASVSFYEHVFLVKHLEEGFPHQGPVRHFMELVVAGLSRNPYLTVQQKKEHISWFRDYFKQKEEVLKEAEVSLN